MELKKICKAFGDQAIFKNYDLIIPEGAVTGISGPSGIGKTTLLRMLAGLEKPDEGEIMGKPDGGTAFVFQENRLIPWMTVRENMAFVLKTPEEKSRIPLFLEMMNLKDLAQRYPAALSGGQQHRVALARALCAHRGLLLMDEPFTGLDRALKSQIISDLKDLWKKERPTVVIAAHDPDVLNGLCHQCIAIENGV